MNTMSTDDPYRELREHAARYGVSSDDLLKRLSVRAKVAGGGCFGMMRPGKGEMTFQMRENRPTPEMQAALDELEAAGAIQRTPLNNGYGGVRYVPLMNFHDFFVWVGKNIGLRDSDAHFKITEPIEPR